MEYSYCSTMFTDGQCARMNTAVNSGTAGRKNLWKAANLAATGVDGPGVLCVADFISSNPVICGGMTVDFEDQSYFNVTGWSWTFEGGTPSTSTDQNPTVTYNTPGTYNVTLQVTDGSGFETTIANDYVTVLADPGDPMPYHEGFESLTAITDGQRFFLYNPNEAEEWEVTTDASSLGAKSAWLHNFGNSDGSVDGLISGPIDLSSVDASETMIFSFDYAYKKLNAGTDEVLRVYVSKDCGETWALRKNMYSDDLNTDTESAEYTPADQGDWKTVTLTNITSAYYVTNLMYKFEFTNAGGNNIYLDNINLYPESMTDLVQQTKVSDISVYPNPAGGVVNIKISGSDDQDYSVSLFSPLGSKIASIYNGPINGNIEYNVSSLPKGVYIIQVESLGDVYTMKLVKE